MGESVGLLFVAGDPTSGEIIAKNIREHFPIIELSYSRQPDESLQLLQEHDYDVVVCDALLRSDARYVFIEEMCSESEIMLIIITPNTDILKEISSLNVKRECIHSVLYKPIMFADLFRAIECALLRVKNKSEETK